MFISKHFNKSNYMGLVYAEIEIISTEDMTLARRGEIDPDEVRRMGVNMLVDTGAYNLVINENIQEYMQYPSFGKVKGELANGVNMEYDLVGPVAIKYKGVLTHVNAAVMPGNAQPLFGVYAIEQLDLIIHPNSLLLEFSEVLRPI